MIKHQLSFAKINLLNKNVVEVIVDQGVVISLEMSEEYDHLLSELFTNNFAILVNSVNQYDFSFEAKLSMASHENLAAIAVVTYDEESKKSVGEIAAMRELDGWNVRLFDGLNLGRQESLDWLQSELNNSMVKS
jgi:hypothetical protein